MVDSLNRFMACRDKWNKIFDEIAPKVKYDELNEEDPDIIETKNRRTEELKLEILEESQVVAIRHG